MSSFVWSWAPNQPFNLFPLSNQTVCAYINVTDGYWYAVNTCNSLAMTCVCRNANNTFYVNEVATNWNECNCGSLDQFSYPTSGQENVMLLSLLNNKNAWINIQVDNKGNLY